MLLGGNALFGLDMPQRPYAGCTVEPLKTALGVGRLLLQIVRLARCHSLPAALGVNDLLRSLPGGQTRPRAKKGRG
jgi:hypothetical protein